MSEPAPPGPGPAGGTFRRRLAAVLGREEAEGDRIWRRTLHAGGALVLVYYLLPAGVFVLLPNALVVLLALAAVLVLEAVRLAGGVRLPTIRSYEVRRPASYAFYAVGLAVALLLFPEPIAVAVVLGTAIVDPLAGELRSSGRWSRVGPAVAWLAYTALAATALGVLGRWPGGAALALGALGGAVAVAVERWRSRWLDDDLTMTVAPALLLYGVGTVALGLPG